MLITVPRAVGPAGCPSLAATAAFAAHGPSRTPPGALVERIGNR
ncbi:hypothetical protein ACFVOR_11075 [Streptomyces sp. NPDC057837]